VRAFCERETLKESAFYFWRREIGRRDRRAMGGQTPTPAFVEVHAAPVAVVGPVERACREPVERESPLELILPGDRRLVIRAGCDVGLLSRVVAVLEARPC